MPTPKPRFTALFTLAAAIILVTGCNRTQTPSTPAASLSPEDVASHPHQAKRIGKI